MNRKTLLAAAAAHAFAVHATAQAAPQTNRNVDYTDPMNALKRTKTDAGATHCSTPAFAIKVIGARTLFDSHQYGTDSPQAERAAQEVIAKAKGSALGELQHDPDGSGISDEYGIANRSKEAHVTATSTQWRAATVRAKQPATGRQYAPA